jgi:hypothetical protein
MNILECWEDWAALLGALSTGALLGHNLWLVAPRLRPAPGERLRIEINTSDLFPTSETAITEDRIADFVVQTDAGAARARGFRVAGASLIAEVDVARRGALLAALTLHPRQISLEPAKFHSYLCEERAQAAIDAREAAGEDSLPGREIYTKYAKLFVGADDGGSGLHQRPCGHRLEILPMANPCALRAGDRLFVQVLLDGAPASGLRVSAGCEGVREGGYLAHATVDDEGRAEILVPGPGRWYLRTHCIRPHENRSVADWESFWSSMTVLGEDAAPGA